MADEKKDLIAGFLPEIAPVTYQRNLIRHVVCELKFPTIYGFVRGKPPLTLANALRKSFPEHGTQDNVNVSAGGVAQDIAFFFKDKKKKNTVTLRPSALTFESNSYICFEDLLEIVLFAAKSAKETIDSEFFTRVGLRYINELPYVQNEIGNWLNPELVMPLSKGSLGSPKEFNGRVATVSENGGFLLQHGIANKKNDTGKRYTLDIDVWKEDVEIEQLEIVLKELHDAEARVFHWSLGPAAFEYMGPGKPKVQ